MSPATGPTSPARGEVWEVDLSPPVGREQSGRQPALIVSDNALNSGPRGLVIVVPITGALRGLPTHVPANPPEGGLTKPSVIMTEQIRAISKERLVHRLGPVPPRVMEQVDRLLAIVLSL